MLKIGKKKVFSFFFLRSLIKFWRRSKFAVLSGCTWGRHLGSLPFGIPKAENVHGSVLLTLHSSADTRVFVQPPYLTIQKLAKATYRVTFDTETYFDKTGAACFYPEVAVLFRVEEPEEHYHIPLLISPFGYSTYRGS